MWNLKVILERENFVSNLKRVDIAFGFNVLTIIVIINIVLNKITRNVRN